MAHGKWRKANHRRAREYKESRGTLQACNSNRCRGKERQHRTTNAHLRVKGCPAPHEVRACNACGLRTVRPWNTERNLRECVCRKEKEKR